MKRKEKQQQQQQQQPLTNQGIPVMRHTIILCDTSVLSK